MDVLLCAMYVCINEFYSCTLANISAFLGVLQNYAWCSSNEHSQSEKSTKSAKSAECAGSAKSAKSAASIWVGISILQLFLPSHILSMIVLT